jgi:hypothetical protein
MRGGRPRRAGRRRQPARGLPGRRLRLALPLRQRRGGAARAAGARGAARAHHDGVLPGHRRDADVRDAEALHVRAHPRAAGERVHLPRRLDRLLRAALPAGGQRRVRALDGRHRAQALRGGARPLGGAAAARAEDGGRGAARGRRRARLQQPALGGAQLHGAHALQPARRSTRITPTCTRSSGPGCGRRGAHPAAADLQPTARGAAGGGRPQPARRGDAPDDRPAAGPRGRGDRAGRRASSGG